MVSEKFQLINLTQNFPSRASYQFRKVKELYTGNLARPLKRAVIFSLFLNTKKLF